MGIKKTFYLILLICSLSSTTFSQSCNQAIKKGLLKGKSYTAECDSMIVLDKHTYEGFYNKIFYYEAIIDNQDKLDSLMRAESKAKDSLIKNLDTKIDIQGNAIKEYRAKIDTLYSISSKSLDLNDKAIKALEKEKKKNKFVKAGAFTLGGICLFMFGILATSGL